MVQNVDSREVRMCMGAGSEDIGTICTFHLILLWAKNALKKIVKKKNKNSDIAMYLRYI